MLKEKTFEGSITSPYLPFKNLGLVNVIRREFNVGMNFFIEEFIDNNKKFNLNLGALVLK